MKKIFLAALLGGLAMFVWESIAHVALPLGRTGFQSIPNEQAVLTAVQSSLGGNHGLYIYPFMAEGANAMQEYERKLQTSPSGILIYHPPGAKAMQPSQLITEFLAEALEALLAALLLAQTRLTSYVSRATFVLGAGILASLVTNISYWNWYGFPSSYTAANMTSQIVGFLCAGLVIAALVKPAPEFRA